MWVDVTRINAGLFVSWRMTGKSELSVHDTHHHHDPGHMSG
jgi:hypothetical protein